MAAKEDRPGGARGPGRCERPAVLSRPGTHSLQQWDLQSHGVNRAHHMKKFLHSLWNTVSDAGDDRVENISADLPYELQSKMFDQLATVSVAGAGLAITLIGSLLRNASQEVWLSVIFFCLAAVSAVGGNKRLINGLFGRRPTLRRSKLDVSVTMMLLGVAAGVLSMSVYSDPAGSSSQAEKASSGE